MALALMDKALYDDAMLNLQQVLICEPDNPFALNNLGYICYKKGIWGEAIEHLTNITQLVSRVPEKEKDWEEEWE